jgi:hypothetical protein
MISYTIGGAEPSLKEAHLANLGAQLSTLLSMRNEGTAPCRSIGQRSGLHESQLPEREDSSWKTNGSP